MKLILRKDVEKLGKTGEVVNVKDGYARNYLLPKEFAFIANQGAIRRIELAGQNRASSIDKQRTAALALATKLTDIELSFSMKAGEADKLYGSVTAQMISAKLAEIGHEIDKNNILLDDPIKTLGSSDVKIKLLSDVFANIKVTVVAEEEVTN